MSGKLTSTSAIAPRALRLMRLTSIAFAPPSFVVLVFAVIDLPFATFTPQVAAQNRIVAMHLSNYSLRRCNEVENLTKASDFAA